MTSRQLAEAYFATFPSADQEAIRASWNGRDLLMEWYNNAVAAGAVPAEYSPGGTGGGGTAGGGGASAKFSGPGGKPTPAELRAWAREQGWSEDFARYSDATLRGWIANYWDSGSNMFKSGRGAEGTFEKPTECPPGTGPSGPNENDPCTAEGYGGGGGAGGAGGAGGGAEGGGGESTKVGGAAGASTLQQYLEALYSNQGGVFAPQSGVEGVGSGYAATPLEHGGVMWSPLDQTPEPETRLARTTETTKLGKCPEGQIMKMDGKCYPVVGGYNPNPPTRFPPRSLEEARPTAIGAAASGAEDTGAAALTSATLNAFGPQAPSATSASPTSQSTASVTTPPPTVPMTPSPTPTPSIPGVAPPANPLVAQVNRRYNPIQNQWWASSPR